MKAELDSKKILRKLVQEALTEAMPAITLPPELQQPTRPAYVSHANITNKSDKQSNTKFEPVTLKNNVDFSTFAKKEWEPSESFIDYIKRVENLTKVGKNKSNGKWYPIMDPNGQFQVIGYGHKIEKTEARRYSIGISDSDVEKLLIADLLSAKQKVDSYLRTKNIDPATLTEQQVEMLVDFAFNGVLYKFPKFVSGVVTNNHEILKREHIRKFKLPNGKVKEMTGRNREFQSRYLS